MQTLTVYQAMINLMNDDYAWVTSPYDVDQLAAGGWLCVYRLQLTMKVKLQIDSVINLCMIHLANIGPLTGMPNRRVLAMIQGIMSLQCDNTCICKCNVTPAYVHCNLQLIS